MQKNKLIILTTLLFALTVVGCNREYRSMVKLAKSRTIAEKDSAATWFYTHKKYDRALPILQELVPLYSGLDEQQRVYYYYCYSHYNMGSLVSAQFYFEDFANKFPSNKHRVEAEFMSAKAYYRLADPYYLDQSFTTKAIDALQLFLSKNPESDYKEEANTMLDNLRERKAKKAFEQASLYYNITYYKAAVEAFTVMINEFPDSKYREEAQFYLVKSSYALAGASIDRRKLGRYQEALKYHERFKAKFPSSEFISDSETIADNSNREIQQLKEKAKQEREQQLFQKIKAELQTVMNSKDEEEVSEKYESALANYNELKEDFPSSRRISEVAKLFEKVNKLQDDK